jgi:octaprenyl-diphosphate synthase
MNQEYTQRIEKIIAALERWLPENPQEAWIKEVFPGLGGKISAETLQELLAPGKDMLSRRGKLWRPLLMTLVCESLGGGDAAVPFAPLVELCHNASLIHDDIEDDSDERRGKPAIHLKYGIDTAINSGSFLYFLASCCIEQCAAEHKSTLYRLWAECMRKLYLGQSMDINWHRNISFVPEIMEYYVMCSLKTGSLSNFAVELGIHAAGSVPKVEQQLSDAAIKLGIGFQILDDVKNLTTGIKGKMRGDDIVEGKKGLPVLLYLHRYPEKRQQVFDCFDAARENNATVAEIESLIQNLVDTGVIEEAQNKGNEFTQYARSVFSAPEHCGVPVQKETRVLLAGLIDFIS